MSKLTIKWHPSEKEVYIWRNKETFSFLPVASIPRQNSRKYEKRFVSLMKGRERETALELRKRERVRLTLCQTQTRAEGGEWGAGGEIERREDGGEGN